MQEVTLRGKKYLFRKVWESFLEVRLRVSEEVSDSDELKSPKSPSPTEPKIASLTTTDDNGNVWLKHIQVETEYRRNGIGSKLIELAKNELGLTHIACVQENKHYSLCLTLDGERLIAKCLRKGIISEDMCFFSTRSSTNPSPAFILEEGEEDPGYDSGLVMNAISGYSSESEQESKATSHGKQKRIPDYFKVIPDYNHNRTNRQFHNLLSHIGFFEGNEKLRRESYKHACEKPRDKYYSYMTEKLRHSS